MHGTGHLHNANILYFRTILPAFPLPSSRYHPHLSPTLLPSLLSFYPAPSLPQGGEQETKLSQTERAQRHKNARTLNTRSGKICYFMPRKSRLTRGIMFSTCPSVHPSVHPSVRSSVTKFGKR